MKYVDFNIDNEWDFEEIEPINKEFIGFEDFYKFLEDNSSLQVFIEDFYNYNKKYKTIKLFLNRYESTKIEFINYAFTWSDTNNSYLWEKLHTKWSPYQ